MSIACDAPYTHLQTTHAHCTHDPDTLYRHPDTEQAAQTHSQTIHTHSAENLDTHTDNTIHTGHVSLLRQHSTVLYTVHTVGTPTIPMRYLFSTVEDSLYVLHTVCRVQVMQRYNEFYYKTHTLVI